MNPARARVRFGLLITNQHLPSAPPAERFAETIEQVRLAQALGFDLVVFGQHFLVNERAAEIGDAWIMNPHATLQTITRQMELYRAALSRAGKPLDAVPGPLAGDVARRRHPGDAAPSGTGSSTARLGGASAREEDH